jgi:hypothetical protein
MGETWIGGRFELTVDESWEEDDDEPTPHIVLWLEEKSRSVLALVAIPPEEPPEAAAVILEAAMREPDFGDPRRPERVKVESPELAAFLVERFPDISVVQAPTPEADEALQEIYANMGDEPQDN